MDDRAHGVDLPGLGGYRVEAVSSPFGTVVAGLPTGGVSGTIENLVAWELPESAATTRWTFDLSGIDDAITEVKLLPITSDRGIEPPVVGPEALVDLTSGPGTTEARPLEDVLLPASSGSAAAGRDTGRSASTQPRPIRPLQASTVR